MADFSSLLSSSLGGSSGSDILQNYLGAQSLANAQPQSSPTTSSAAFTSAPPSTYQAGTTQQNPIQLPSMNLLQQSQAQPQIGPTQGAAMGQQPANPMNQAPAQPVAPQQMSMPQGQGAPGPMQIPNAAPVAPQQQWSDINPGAPLVGGGNANAQGMVPQGQPAPQAVPQGQPSPQGAVPGQPAPQAGGQTTNNVTPQDLLGNNIFNNMLNAESGNRDFNPDGTPVTSGSGAKYAAQVMPATAAKPGFGIRPAANDSPEEYNRVGREYHQAMRDRYKDEEKAVAAYNAGPRKVEQAVAISRQTGKDWKEYLPQETKDYLAKVNPNGVMAQAGQQAQMLQTSAQAGNGSQGQMGPSGMTGNADHDALISAGNNISKLNDLATNPNTNPAVRQAAYQTINDISSNAIGKDRVQKEMTDNANRGDSLSNARMMQDRGPKGSMARALFYELMGAHTAAANEYNNLGVGAQWVAGMGPDGQMMTVKQGADGRALAAIDPSTGEHITDPRELEKYNGAGMAGMKSGGANMIYDHADGTTHLVTESTLPNGMKRYYDATSQKWLPQAPSNLRHVGQENPLEKRAQEKANQERSRLEDINNKARSQGAPEPFSQQEKESRVAAVYNGVKAGHIPAGAPTAPTTPPEISSNNQAAAASGTTPTAIAPTPAPTPTATAPQPATSPLRAQATEIYEGRQPMPTGMGANNYRNRAINDEVQKIAQERGQPFNAQAYKKNQELVKNFATGDSGKAVDALKTAYNHIDELTPAIKELNNGNFPAANAFVNKFATAVGGSKATTVEQIGPIVGNEIEKTWNPRMGTEAERAHIRESFNAARSPEQLNKAIEQYKQLMMGKLKPLEDRYSQTGQKDFWSSQINDDKIKTDYDKYRAKQNVEQGKAPEGTTKSGIKFKVVE
jgi:hypothetical protein